MTTAFPSRGEAKILARPALWFCACNLLAAVLAAQCSNPTQVPNQTIGSGAYNFVDNNALSASSVVVNGSGSLTLVAGNCIQLLPGFHATAGTAGTTFHGWVETGPSTVSFSPASGSGAASGLSQPFTWTVSSPSGYTNVSDSFALFNTSISGTSACFIHYSPSSNLLYLADNSGASWSSGIVPGTSGSVSNSQCTVNGAGSGFSASGTQLALTVSVAFQASFTGTKNEYLIGYDYQGLNTTWQQMGTWTIPPPPTDFTLSLTPTSSPAKAMIGGSATYTVTVAPINAFSDTVTLSAPGLPAGASASFSPATITGSGSSTMTVTAPSNGTGSFTVTANASDTNGSLSHNAVSVLAVQDYTVTLSPYNYGSPPVITAGGTQTFTIGAAGINGFTGYVSLTWPPQSNCNLTALNLPSQVAAGSAVTMTMAPYGQQQCIFNISANANGDVHVLNGSVIVSSAANFAFTLPSNQGTLTATPSTQAAQVVFTPTLAAVNSFCGTITFQVLGLPTGVTGTAPPVNLCGSPQTAQITVTVPPGVPQGMYPLTINAFGSNGNSGPASSQYIYPFLQVGGGGSGFTITTSAAQTIAPGGTALYTVTVSGSSGLGNVTLTASGGPPGATVLFNGAGSASVVVGGSATMTVAVPSNAGLGTYSVPITGMLGTVPKYGSAVLTVAASSAGNILTPANGGFIYGGSTAFTWSPGVGATQYVLTVTPANSQSTSVTVGPSSQPSAIIALPTANQSVTATLLTYTPNGLLQSQTYTYMINPNPGSQPPVLDTTQQQPTPYVPNNGIESRPYTYYFTGGDARAMAEGQCLEAEVAVRMVLLTQTTATLAFTGAKGAKPQASELTCTCPGGGIPIKPPPASVDTTPIITGVTTPIPANVSQSILISGMYFGDPAAGANDTVQICQNGGGYCTSVAADLLDDGHILASVTLSAGDYTVYVFSNGSAGTGFMASPGGGRRE